MSNHGCLIFQVDIRLSDELFTIRFTDILHLFNLQDPSGVLEELIRGHSSAGRAPALQAGGRGFDSRCLHQAG